MNLSIDPKKGVRFENIRKKGMALTAFILALETVFTMFLYISLAQRVFLVTPAEAQPGPPEEIAYQGMLTDSSGNPLGGAGSVYCFRYSIWTAAASGTQLWPSPSLGDASTTPSNSTTTVIDGIFSDELGRTDSIAGLDFDSNTTSTNNYFLQVQVSTSSVTCATGLETLAPRQEITSDAFSQTAQAVYSSQLRTLSNTNSVQVGTGAGVAAGGQTLLSLDVVNTGESIGGTCSTNGTLWYDSNLKRALVCEQNLIIPISQTETVMGNGLTGSSTIVNPVWSAGANISFSTNGSTISVIGGAGGGATLSQFEWPAGAGVSQSAVALAANGGITFVPFTVGQNITATKAYALISYSNTTTSSASTASQSISIGLGIYTLGGGTSTGTLSSVTTGSSLYAFTYSSSASNSSLLGIRRISIPITINATPGAYWYGLWIRTTTGNALSMALSFMGASVLAAAYSGNFSSATATSEQFVGGLGVYTAGTAALPLSMSIASLSDAGAAADAKEPYIVFSNY